MGLDHLTDYERQAWEHSLDVLYGGEKRPRLLPAKLRDAGGRALERAATALNKMPGWDTAVHIVEAVFDGTLSMVFEPAMRSVSVDRIVARYRKRFPEVTSLDDVRALELRARDELPLPRAPYSWIAAAEGGGSALAVTGAVVSTSVSGGTTAGVAVGAVAADSVASLALMGRTVGRVAAQYGYDVRVPEEELFAMGVLSLGVASSMGAKAEALSALSKLTQQMMRHATWDQLNQHLLVKVIQRAYLALGFRLTQKRLAQIVPAAGIAINSTLSAHAVDQTMRRAQAVYRIRALSDRYGIDPEEWLRGRPSQRTDEDQEEIVDVVEILEEEREAEEGEAG